MIALVKCRVLASVRRNGDNSVMNEEYIAPRTQVCEQNMFVNLEYVTLQKTALFNNLDEIWLNRHMDGEVVGHWRAIWREARDRICRRGSERHGRGSARE